MSKEGIKQKIKRVEETIEIGPLKLESGTVLPNVSLRYERVGRTDLPVVLICHALTGNHQTVGTEDEPGWWNGFVGYDSPVDLQQYQVITFNVLGGCSGSTGPASKDRDGREHRLSFPFVSVRDMVHAQHEALLKMDITHLRAVIGGSLGGMQTLEWGVLYPSFMDQLFVLAATPTLSDYGVAFNRIGIHAIEQDPRWDNGDYEKSSDVKGFEVARMVGLVTYRSPSLFTNRFDREEKKNRDDGRPYLQVESYLRYQGEKITKRFDPNSYLYLLYAMNGHDIGRGRGGVKKAANQIQAEVIGVGFTGDLLYPPGEIKTFINSTAKGYFHEIETAFGHDGFLVEYDKWGPIIRGHLAERSSLHSNG
ncbi:homoserine O-acetyltransferase MetX [Jeotgalibacillus proteolyticus]|uniref:Homoserine O-acetyltransferase n=1 Tax=Jeotgalibacillus proteolyticus TaxID=2082395 RepID=A0A2S5GCM7_9BACL|nr:homoserine O-acetyltransferase [Jeotgalibacillus proteolyticus]PPA70653.1 homoserine O-acetyltransferase [Jeotgalibacillus proteolyticus]